MQKVVNTKTVYQTNWLGEPSLQLPQDLLIFQELIVKSSPDVILEVGLGWGGTTLFLASICSLLGRGRVIAIDTFIPPDLVARIGRYSNLRDRITFIEGDSLSAKVHKALKNELSANQSTLVLLDSKHTSEHVFEELNVYAAYVKPGGYMVCEDTHVHFIDANSYPNKEYGSDNNPLIGLQRFLKTATGSQFAQDFSLEKRYGISLHAMGYLNRLV